MNETSISETHISEEQLVLFYYGEAADATPIHSHLAQCELCRAEYRALQTVLNTVDSATVPDRDPEYGTAVWRRIEKRVGGRGRFFTRKPRWFSWWMWAPLATAMLLLAFWAGRVSHGPVAPAVSASAPPVRERILLVAVGDHLERSQMVLAEISNTPDRKGKIDISDQQRLAEDLIDSNRLYRQTANTTGESQVANVLDDLERVLLEIANSPSQIDQRQLDELREQIKDRGLLFRIRVIGSNMQQKEKMQESAPAPKQDRKQGTQL